MVHQFKVVYSSDAKSQDWFACSILALSQASHVCPLSVPWVCLINRLAHKKDSSNWYKNDIKVKAAFPTARSSLHLSCLHISPISSCSFWRKKLRAETRSPRGCEYFNNLLLAVWWRGYTTEWAKRISLLAGRKHALVHTTFIRSTYVSRRQSLTVKSTTGPNGWYFRQQWISKERQYDKTNPTATLLPNKVDRACNTKHSWNRSNQTWS